MTAYNNIFELIGNVKLLRECFSVISANNVLRDTAYRRAEECVRCLDLQTDSVND